MGISRRGSQIFAAAVTVLSMLSLFAPAAHAAETRNAARGGVGAAAWTPVISPIDGRKEKIHRNQSTDERDSLLRNCWAGYLCVAAGQGDGMHTVWELWYCGERSLANMIDAGAINNRQTGGAVAYLLNQNHGETDRVNPGNQKDVNWLPVYYLDPC